MNMRAAAAHSRARDKFALLIAHARALIDPTDPEMAPTAEAFDGIELAFHEAMAGLNREIDKSLYMAASLREYAARYDTLHALIMQSSDTDSYAMREAVVEHNAAAATLAEIGRDIDKAAKRASERAAGT